MALKRVSDLENRNYEDIDKLLNSIYITNNPDNKKLLMSKIEVSEATNTDCSLYKSYAYDIQSLSGIFTDQILHRNTFFRGKKEFGDDVVIHGSLSVISDIAGNNNDVYIDKKDITIKGDKLHLETDNGGDIDIESGNGVRLESYNNMHLSSGGQLFVNAEENINIETNNKLKVNCEESTISAEKNSICYTDNFTIYYKDSNGEVKEVVVFGHSDDDKPTVTFGEDITSSNPISGYINHALWS